MTLPRALGALLLAGALVPAVPATASAAGSGPGECRNDEGVTVVVDFTDLGGDVVVRCVRGPLPEGVTGLEALRGAGFTVEGTARWGDAFVCRIQGRPAGSEALEYDGESDYHERCQDTPPAQAYWGYWYAADGGSWRYSSESAATRQVTEGGFEGWAFALDEPSGKRTPGYIPDRPNGTPTPEPTPSAELAPSADPGGDGDRGGSGPRDRQTSAPPSTSAPSTPPTTAPTSVPTETESAGTQPRHPADNKRHQRSHDRRPDAVAPPSGAAYRSDAEVTGELPAVPVTDAGGSPAGTVLGAAVLVLVGVGGGVVWWRRRARP